VTVWKQSRVSSSLVSAVLCQPYSLYSFLVAAGRHTAAANPTDLLSVLGGALSSQLVGPNGSSEHRKLEGTMVARPTSSTPTETEIHTVLRRHPGRLIHLPRPEEMTHLVNELCMGLVTNAVLLSLQTPCTARRDLSREQKKKQK